jgi:hypothetical protein
MGFLPPGEIDEESASLPLHQATTRTVVAEPAIEGDDELGPVAKALLEALKESGNQDLLLGDDGNEDEDKE